MQSLHPLIVAVTAFALAGCTVIQPIDSPVTPLSFDPPLGCSPEDVAALPAGAVVDIVEHFSEHHTRVNRGTILKSTPDGVALMNCSVKTAAVLGTPILSKTPVIDRYFKNTGVSQSNHPVLWIPRRRMNSIRVIQPPPLDYVAPEIPLDTTVEHEFERIGIDFDFNISEVKPGTLVPVVMPPGAWPE